MNRTIAAAAVTCYHCDSHDHLQKPIAGIMAACTFVKASDNRRPHALRLHLQDLDHEILGPDN